MRELEMDGLLRVRLCRCGLRLFAFPVCVLCWLPFLSPRPCFVSSMRTAYSSSEGIRYICASAS